MTVTHTSLLLSTLLCVFCVEDCGCFPNGSVVTSCHNMLPVHSNFIASSSSSPVRLRMSSDTYSPGGLITVTMEVMNSSMYFLGFMLQARSNRQTQAGQPVGKFININTNTCTPLDCSDMENSSVSQASGNRKTSIELTWEAPGNGSYGDVFFCATVVQSYTTFWANVNSDTLTLSTSSAAVVISSSALLFISMSSVSVFR